MIPLNSRVKNHVCAQRPLRRAIAKVGIRKHAQHRRGFRRVFLLWVGHLSALMQQLHQRGPCQKDIPFEAVSCFQVGTCHSKCTLRKNPLIRPWQRPVITSDLFRDYASAWFWHCSKTALTQGL